MTVTVDEFQIADPADVWRDAGFSVDRSRRGVVGPSSLWGITYVVVDIDATAAFLGDRTLPVKDAVQPGRRITTVRHKDLGMSVRTAMIPPPILSR